MESTLKLIANARRVVPATESELVAVGEAIDASGILGRLPHSKEVVIEVFDPVTAGATLAEAHHYWYEAYLAKLDVPAGVRAQEMETVCPAGLIKVDICCINDEKPVSGSWLSFTGTLVSLLVSLKDKTIWDGRSETAS